MFRGASPWSLRGGFYDQGPGASEGPGEAASAATRLHFLIRPGHHAQGSRSPHRALEGPLSGFPGANRLSQAPGSPGLAGITHMSRAEASLTCFRAASVPDRGPGPRSLWSQQPASPCGCPTSALSLQGPPLRGQRLLPSLRKRPRPVPRLPAGGSHSDADTWTSAGHSASACASPAPASRGARASADPGRPAPSPVQRRALAVTDARAWQARPRTLGPVVPNERALGVPARPTPPPVPVPTQPPRGDGGGRRAACYVCVSACGCAPRIP